MQPIQNLTSLQLTRQMGAGWNLGNTLDAHWHRNRPTHTITDPLEQEQFWHNPVTTPELVRFMYDAGFRTLRVPVTWYIFTGADYTVDPAWMNRVREVVGYGLDAGMYVILNIHHDDYERSRAGDFVNGWFRLYHQEENRPLNGEEKGEIKGRFTRLWEQIAACFRDYDERLLFEGINEPRAIGLHDITRPQWDEMGGFLNELLQAFVDTVRAGGGKNAGRHLLVTPYFASVGMDSDDGEGRIAAFVDKENKRLRVTDPRGAKEESRLIASLHYYEPWGFAAAPANVEWYSAYHDLNVASVSSNTENVFRIFRENFIDLGIPVIMGETGAVNRPMPDGSSNEAERVKWAHHYVGGLAEMGVPTVIWDDGGAFKLVDRRALDWFFPDLAKALVEAGARLPGIS
jgi:endoglucanase